MLYFSKLRVISVLLFTLVISYFAASNVFKFDDDYFSKKEQSLNQKLCDVRSVFDKYNLISGLHSFYSKENEIYKNILPPLSLLSENNEKDLIKNLNKLNFKNKPPLAA